MYRVDDIFLKGWRPYAWILGLALAVYAISLSFGFTYLDDNEFIIDNYAFIRDLAHAGEAFFQTVFSNISIPYYRPILTVSFMIDAQIGGAAPFIYHLTNILLHGAAACLVFMLARALSQRPQSAFVYAAIFCVHPALTQAVAWVPGRNDILLAIFVLLAVLAFLRYCETGAFLAYAASVLFFWLSLFTKESALILLGLAAIFLMAARKNRYIRKGWPLIALGWGAVAVFWFLMRSAALVSSHDRSTIGGMYDAVMKSLPAFMIYIGKIFLPFNLSVFPTIRDSSFVYGIVSTIIVIAIVCLSKRRSWRLIGFGALWSLSFLASSFIRPSAECVLDFQEHRIYLPFIGFIIMLIGTGFLDGVNLQRRNTLIAFAAAVAIFASLTVNHERAFKDKWSFWGNAVRTAPKTAYVHLRYGFICYLHGSADEALSEYKKALILDPTIPAAHTKLGLLYMDRKMYNEADAEFREEVRISPMFDMAYMCLGVARYKQGRFDDSERLWKRSIRINPYTVEARKNLAVYYYERNDRARAACFARQLRDMGIPVPQDYLEARN